MWWIIITVIVIVILVALYKYGSKIQEEEDAAAKQQSTPPTNGSMPPRYQTNNQNQMNPEATLYKSLTGRDYDQTLDPCLDIPLRNNYGNVKSVTDLTKVLVKFMYGDIYLAFLRGEQFSVSAGLISKYARALRIDMNSFNMDNFQGDDDFFARQFSANPSNVHPSLIRSVESAVHSLVNNVCQKTLNNRVNAMDSQYVYKYSVGQVTPRTDIEKIELDIYVANYPDRIKNAEKETYSNEDMVRIKQVLATIPPKISEINNFNNQLQNTINEYEEKAIKTIEVAYASALTNSNFSRDKYFKSFDRISQRYSSEVNPVVAATVDASVKKVTAFINQKQDIINKNNADIAKYNEVMEKLQKQYDDEFALQKIKEINSDVNTQMNNISDIAKKEEKNYEIQNIMRDIDILDKEINERRNYEIQFGQIEI